MATLRAVYQIPIQEGWLLVCLPSTEDLCYSTAVDDFEVEICLNPQADSWRNIYAQAPPATTIEPYYGMSQVKISVSREENEVPPEPQILNGMKSYADRHVYLDERIPAYRAAALMVLRHTILFFKYALHNPRLHLPNQHGESFLKPKWIWADAEEKELRTSRGFGIGYPLPTLGEFDVQCLSTDNEADLQVALKNRINTELFEELLSDAQAEIFRGNLRRGVLEMAIACEVAVKQRYSLKRPAFSVEDEKVLRLIHQHAQQQFGSSFKTAEPDAFQDIDFLFRARNKVAHEGRAYYRDDRAVTHTVDRLTLEKWWRSVGILLRWAHTL